MSRILYSILLFALIAMNPASILCADGIQNYSGVRTKVKRDWGIAYMNGYNERVSMNIHFKKAALGALRQYKFTDVSNFGKITAAKRLISSYPLPLPWPAIYRIDNVTGYFAFICFRTTDIPEIAMIVISAPLIKACDEELLSGILAHEMAHPLTDREAGLIHRNVDMFAVNLVGREPLRKGLELIRKKRDEYLSRINRKIPPKERITELSIGMGSAHDLDVRIESLTGGNP